MVCRIFERSKTVLDRIRADVWLALEGWKLFEPRPRNYLNNRFYESHWLIFWQYKAA
jgi:hypothetical protein